MLFTYLVFQLANRYLITLKYHQNLILQIVKELYFFHDL